MAGAETSQKYGAARVAAEAGGARVPPFARVLIELLAKRWNGTLLIHGEDGEHEAAVRFEEGLAVAAKVDAPSATLLQSLIPLCVWMHKRFEFLDREDGVGSGDGVVTGQVDPLGLITAAVRGPIRDDVLEEAVSSLGEEPFRLRPNVLLSRYGFTAQELHAVACLQRGPISVPQLRDRAQVPEHALRRVLYVLWVTHALSLMMSPRRVVSGTVRQPDHPSLPSQRAQADAAGLQLPPMPSMSPAELSGATVEMPNVDEQARRSSVPSRVPPLYSDVAPSPRGRYHVQNPDHGVNAVDARMRTIPPIVEALLRATNRPRPSGAPPASRSQAPRSAPPSRTAPPGRMATPPRAPGRTLPPAERIRPVIESPPIVSEPPAAHESTPPSYQSFPAISIESEPPMAIESEPPISIESLPPIAIESEPPAASRAAIASPPPLESSPPSARTGTRPPQEVNPTRSFKPVRNSPHTRSLKPVRPSPSRPPSAPVVDPVKPTRSLKPVHPTPSPTDALRSSAPARSSRPSVSRRPSQPGVNRSEGDQRFSLAEGLMRRGDFSGAAAEMQEAMKLRGPRAADEALFAWILYQQRGGAEVPETAWQAIERAFRLDLHSDVAYHYKAMLLKREGRLAEARAHFRRALHLNPRNVDARRELRVLLMRKRDTVRQPSGLLNKIFGKTPAPK